MRQLVVLSVLLAAASCGPPAAELTVISVSELPTVEQSSLIEGRDGGQSAAIFGRSVWTYGDTVITVPDDHNQMWHHNSISWTTDMDARDGVSTFSEPLEDSGAPRHFIPPSPSELEFNLAHAGDNCSEQPCGARWAIWPGAPVWDPKHNRALVPYSLIYAEPGEFNFHSVGASFATWTELAAIPTRPVVDPLAEHPDLIWGETDPGFGVGSVVDGDYLMTWSCDEPGDGNPCKLARVLLEEVHMRDRWDYFDGDGWSPTLADAKPLFEGAPIMSCAFHSALNLWMVVYTKPFDNTIWARTAPELSGPWSGATALHTVDEPNPPYDAIWHPEFNIDGGKTMFVTYSRPTTGWFGRELALLELQLDTSNANFE